MRETKYYCDVCKKEIIKDIVTNSMYYFVGIRIQYGLITKPVPNNAECCSIECAKKWLDETTKENINDK